MHDDDDDNDKKTRTTEKKTLRQTFGLGKHFFLLLAFYFIFFPQDLIETRPRNHHRLYHHLHPTTTQHTRKSSARGCPPLVRRNKQLKRTPDRCNCRNFTTLAWLASCRSSYTEINNNFPRGKRAMFLLKRTTFRFSTRNYNIYKYNTVPRKPLKRGRYRVSSLWARCSNWTDISIYYLYAN